MTPSKVEQEILLAFDKLKIFSAPIPESIDGVRTFVVDIQTVKDFLTKSFSTLRQSVIDEVLAVVPKERIVGEGTYCEHCKQHIAAGECDCTGWNKFRSEVIAHLEALRKD